MIVFFSFTQQRYRHHVVLNVKNTFIWGLWLDGLDVLHEYVLVFVVFHKTFFLFIERLVEIGYFLRNNFLHVLVDVVGLNLKDEEERINTNMRVKEALSG